MNKKEQIDQLTHKIDVIVDAYRQLDDICDKAFKAGVLDCDGSFYRAICNSFEEMLKLLDIDGWISWYIYDNDCGKKAMKAGYHGKTKPIRTSRQLAQLILNDR